jgi:hypothetical protein
MAELNDRVEDWKGHKLENFGDLLLYGTFQVTKGDPGNPKDQEREASDSISSWKCLIWAVQDLPFRDDLVVL